MKRQEFEYKVSLIIPVYNVEDYLEECLDSIVQQTIDKSEIEVLLIDDGSSDNSLKICREYGDLYPFFKVFTKENTGVSATRNFGIKQAAGKYIMYLDSDDTLSKETIKNVTSFFDKHYMEVDVVTYPEYTTINGVKQSLHFRYKYLKKDGIYDLEQMPYALQTRLGICVKNSGAENFLFDETMSYHEDQKYIVQILTEKMKIGFCSKAAYFWKRNDGGIMGNSSNPIQVFEVATKFYEDIFEKYDVVPTYFQAMFIHDINWKMRSNMFFPYHYGKEEFENAMLRIKKLLQKVDVSAIRQHPGVDSFHVYYFIRLKEESVVSIARQKTINIYYQKECIYKASKIEMIVNSIKMYDGKLKFDCFLKSPIFDFMEKPILNMVITKSDGEQEKIEMDLFESAGGFYKSKTKTNLFWGFVYEVEIQNDCKISFEVLLDGLKYGVNYYFMERCNISKEYAQLVTKGYNIKFVNDYFLINKNTRELYQQKIFEFSHKVANLNADLPFTSMSDYFDETVWLYYDCSGVEKDNGYYQFCHDMKKKDGITRYYICPNDIAKYGYLFEGFEEQVVKFGSKKHKLLYLVADKIITAYIEEKNMIPFDNAEYKVVKQFVNHQVVYLQHGILHAHLPWKYAPGRILADRIVVSSQFELNSFNQTYHFPEYMLIPSGMARFEKIDRNYKQTMKILFAPSWRNYLIGAAVGNKWLLTEEKFLASSYYKELNAFLNDENLEKVLEEYDLILDFKIHPIFVPYLYLFENNNERVKFVTENIIEEEYKIVITDFSSFIFNFAYMKRPIIYYVPDYIEFKAGLNQYWELDLPFEDAFGPLVTDSEGAINEIVQICKSNFAINEKFANRMDTFFVPLENTCKKLYEELMKYYN